MSYPHHLDTVTRAREHFRRQPEVIALLLGGSIAHHFETAESDVDVMVVVSETTYAERARQGQLVFADPTLSAYPGGYVDGKYITRSFIEQVARQGSEPARFAFQGAQVLFSDSADVPALLSRAARYPVEGKAERLLRFYAQFEAWHWYAHEALRLDNRYLLWQAVSKLVLFGGRLVLAHNDRLYPYHKWFLRVLADAPDRPADMMATIDRLLCGPSDATVREYHRLITGFRDWGAGDQRWPLHFLFDSELAWQRGAQSIDDL